MQKNSVIWITGFSGAGKTTVAKILQQEFFKCKAIKAILLDGDEIREVLDKVQNAYSSVERIKLAYQYAKFGKLLAEQGFVVIIATISMFEEVRQWNRLNYKNYLEIYLKVSEEERLQRNSEKLYSLSKDMVTGNEHYVEPKNPDLIFEDNQKFTAEKIAQIIFNYWNNKLN
jgi:adenylylsulfate kinase-like enzyme